MRAMLSLAGVRMLTQGSVSVTATDTIYTVVESNARRVICFHNGGGTPTNLDIRFNVNATALVTHFPIAFGKYFVVDARGPYTIPAAAAQGNPVSVAGDVLHFISTNGTITMFVMEID
jgi:hypothetical protein